MQSFRRCTSSLRTRDATCLRRTSQFVADRFATIANEQATIDHDRVIPGVVAEGIDAALFFELIDIAAEQHELAGLGRYNHLPRSGEQQHLPESVLGGARDAPLDSVLGAFTEILTAETVNKSILATVSHGEQNHEWTRINTNSTLPTQRPFVSLNTGIRVHWCSFVVLPEAVSILTRGPIRRGGRPSPWHEGQTAEFVRIRAASSQDVGSLTTSATNPFFRPTVTDGNSRDHNRLHLSPHDQELRWCTHCRRGG